MVPMRVFEHYYISYAPGSWKNTPEQRIIPWHFCGEDDDGDWWSTGKEKVRWPGVPMHDTPSGVASIDPQTGELHFLMSL